MYLSLAVIWQPTLAQCYLCKKPQSHWRGLFLLHDPPELSRLFGSGCPCPSEKLSLWNWREWIIRDPLRLDDEPWRVSDPLINHLIDSTRQRDDDLVEHQVDKNVYLGAGHVYSCLGQAEKRRAFRVTKS